LIHEEEGQSTRGAIRKGRGGNSSPCPVYIMSLLCMIKSEGGGYSGKATLINKGHLDVRYLGTNGAKPRSQRYCASKTSRLGKREKAVAGMVSIRLCIMPNDIMQATWQMPVIQQAFQTIRHGRWYRQAIPKCPGPSHE